MKRAAAFLLILFVGSTLPLLNATVHAQPNSSFSQTFSINPTPGTYGSNRNYLMNDNGTDLQNFGTTVAPSGFLNGLSNPPANLQNFSIQMNAFNPVGFGADTMQYVVYVDVGDTTPGAVKLQVGFEVFYALHGGLTFSDIPTPLLVLESLFKGAAVSISTTTLANGNVAASTASITFSNGTTKTIGSLSIPSADQFPAVAYETDIVGFGGGVTSTFTQGRGNIAYSSSAPMGFSTAVGPIGLSYTASKANYGTNEQSNLGYGAVSSTGVITSSITTSSTSPCENCQSTNATQVVPYSIKPGQFAADLGPISYSTSLSGFTWNVSDSQSLSFGLPSPASSILFNSTLTSIQLSGITFFYKPEQYQTLITITGTGTGSAVCIPVSGTGGNIAFNATANPTELQVGTNILDWKDIPGSMNPSFNSTSSQLCYTPPLGPYSIDPLALDGTSTCVPASTTCNLSLTTSNTNVVVVVIEHSTSSSCSAPTATGLTFTRRVNSHGGDGDCVAEYYSVSAAALSSKTIACNWNDSVAHFCTGFGVSGANTATPFDSHAGLPCSNNAGGVSSSPSCTISTSNANDFIIGAASNGNNVGWTVGSGFTKITSAATNCPPGAPAGHFCNEYEIVSSTQTNLAVGMTISPTNSFWDALADAIQQAASNVNQGIQITTLPAGAPSATITVAGCSVSNSTFTADGFTHTYSLTASCSVTLTNPTFGIHSGYSFDVSPHPTGAHTLTFNTCSAPGPCSLASNNTYYTLSGNYTATPQTPNVSDGGYTIDVIGPYLSVNSFSNFCVSWVAGQGVKGCNGIFNNYKGPVSLTNPIGNTWNAIGNDSFSDSTPNHIHNVNYVQTVAGGSPNLDWLLVVPFAVLGLVVGIGRKKLRF